MAIFNTPKKKDIKSGATAVQEATTQPRGKAEKKEKNPSGATPPTVFDYGFDRSVRALVRPRMTEKASLLMERRVYVFNVTTDATKADIKRAVEARYGVVPLRIAVAPVPPKARRLRGKRGMKPGGKKAFVYLKKDDKIEVM